jgi:hypothetical protein
MTTELVSTPMAPRLILAGIGLADRETLADHLAFLESESILALVGDVVRNLTAQAGRALQVGNAEAYDRLAERLNARASAIAQDPQVSDDAMRLALWMHLREALGLAPDIAFSFRGASHATADLGIEVAAALAAMFPRNPSRQGAIGAFVDKAERALGRGESIDFATAVQRFALAQGSVWNQSADAVDESKRQAQVSAFFPALGGKAAVSLVALLINPILALPVAGAATWLAHDASHSALLRSYAAGAAAAFARIGRTDAPAGIAAMLRVFVRLPVLSEQHVSAATRLDDARSRYRALFDTRRAAVPAPVMDDEAVIDDRWGHGALDDEGLSPPHDDHVRGEFAGAATYRKLAGTLNHLADPATSRALDAAARRVLRRCVVVLTERIDGLRQDAQGLAKAADAACERARVRDELIFHRERVAETEALLRTDGELGDRFPVALRRTTVAASTLEAELAEYRTLRTALDTAAVDRTKEGLRQVADAVQAGAARTAAAVAENAPKVAEAIRATVDAGLSAVRRR